MRFTLANSRRKGVDLTEEVAVLRGFSVWYGRDEEEAEIICNLDVFASSTAADDPDTEPIESVTLAVPKVEIDANQINVPALAGTVLKVLKAKVDGNYRSAP